MKIFEIFKGTLMIIYELVDWILIDWLKSNVNLPLSRPPFFFYDEAIHTLKLAYRLAAALPFAYKIYFSKLKVFLLPTTSQN